MSSLHIFRDFSFDPSKKTIWIFGAGASCSAPYNVPTQAGILRHFETKGSPGQSQDNRVQLRDRVRGHCERVFPGIDWSENWRMDLEDVFSSFELPLVNPSAYPVPEVEHARRAMADLTDLLIYATRAHGRGDAKKWYPFRRETTHSPYAELLEKTVRDPNDAKRQCFVTMNYDIHLDRCMLNLQSLDEVGVDLDVDYGVHFANIRTSDSADFNPPRLDKALLLLRLHGSLNWLRCASCQSVFTTVRKQVLDTDRLAGMTCSACQQPTLRHILVYPSRTRKYTDPYIKIVWGRMREQLIQSEQWFFVGYSLPLADFHLRELCREAIRIRESRGQHHTDIYLVDHSASYKGVGQRYADIFGSRLKVWEATDAGFAGFVELL